MDRTEPPPLDRRPGGSLGEFGEAVPFLHAFVNGLVTLLSWVVLLDGAPAPGKEGAYLLLVAAIPTGWLAGLAVIRALGRARPRRLRALLLLGVLAAGLVLPIALARESLDIVRRDRDI